MSGQRFIVPTGLCSILPNQIHICHLLSPSFPSSPHLPTEHHGWCSCAMTDELQTQRVMNRRAAKKRFLMARREKLFASSQKRDEKLELERILTKEEKQVLWRVSCDAEEKKIEGEKHFPLNLQKVPIYVPNRALFFFLDFQFPRC